MSIIQCHYISEDFADCSSRVNFDPEKRLCDYHLFSKMDEERTLLREELKRERKTVDFYGDIGSWTADEYWNYKDVIEEELELIDDTFKTGGKLARETIKQRKIEV